MNTALSPNLRFLLLSAAWYHGVPHTVAQTGTIHQAIYNEHEVDRGTHFGIMNATADVSTGSMHWLQLSTKKCRLHSLDASMHAQTATELSGDDLGGGAVLALAADQGRIAALVMREYTHYNLGGGYNQLDSVALFRYAFRVDSAKVRSTPLRSASGLPPGDKLWRHSSARSPDHQWTVIIAAAGPYFGEINGLYYRVYDRALNETYSGYCKLPKQMGFPPRWTASFSKNGKCVVSVVTPLQISDIRGHPSGRIAFFVELGPDTSVPILVAPPGTYVGALAALPMTTGAIVIAGIAGEIHNNKVLTFRAETGLGDSVLTYLMDTVDDAIAEALKWNELQTVRFANEGLTGARQIKLTGPTVNTVPLHWMEWSDRREGTTIVFQGYSADWESSFKDQFMPSFDSNTTRSTDIGHPFMLPFLETTEENIVVMRIGRNGQMAPLLVINKTMRSAAMSGTYGKGVTVVNDDDDPMILYNGIRNLGLVHDERSMGRWVDPIPTAGRGLMNVATTVVGDGTCFTMQLLSEGGDPEERSIVQPLVNIHRGSLPSILMRFVKGDLHLFTMRPE